MSFKYAWIVPISLIIIPITFVITYFIAVSKGHVASIFPYISDTGALPPESCIFAQLLNIGALLGGITVYLRYRQLKEVQLTFQETHRKWVSRLNCAMLYVGYTACFGISLVANFQEENVGVVHYIGALMAFFFGLVYGFGQTILSYVIDRFIITICVAHLRFVLVIMTTLLFCLMFSHNMIADNLSSHSLLPFIHRKVNETDEAYNWYLISAFSEWGMAATTISFFITFAAEFRKIIFHSPRILLRNRHYSFNSNKKIEQEQLLLKQQNSSLATTNFENNTQEDQNVIKSNILREKRSTNKYAEIRLPRAKYVPQQGNQGARNLNYYNAMTIGPHFAHKDIRNGRYYRSFEQTEPVAGEFYKYGAHPMSNRLRREQDNGQRSLWFSE